MKNNQISLYSRFQPSMTYRLLHSKGLIVAVAVLGAGVMAFAAALVVNRFDAQQGVPVAAVAAPSKPAADTAQAGSANTVKPIPAAVLVARSTGTAVCLDCGKVQSVTVIERQGQVKAVPVSNTTMGSGHVAGDVVGGLAAN